MRKNIAPFTGLSTRAGDKKSQHTKVTREANDGILQENHERRLIKRIVNKNEP